ncbi:hypothetical protein N7495_004689 [Penicillium taxi]|uniref:uncharacterized protein n=1 Tax=Penicillium taxi TaxID=168475 RepID=UPI0025458A5C|nr:uncharacterized protein N7495_004689 [Penicillium taxi]KAJ5899945.1 hypothetical protein N7495_004689 [Penicillium taxi]
MKTDLAIRAQVVSLKAFTELTSSEIATMTGLSKSSVNSIYARAKERGFDHNLDCAIYDRYVEDAPRSGRPQKQEARSD